MSELSWSFFCKIQDVSCLADRWRAFSLVPAPKHQDAPGILTFLSFFVSSWKRKVSTKIHVDQVLQENLVFWWQLILLATTFLTQALPLCCSYYILSTNCKLVTRAGHFQPLQLSLSFRLNSASQSANILTRQDKVQASN